MFDLNEIKTLPEQVRLLVQVLLFEIIVCGIVNTIGRHFTAGDPRSTVSLIITLCAFMVTGFFLSSNTSSVLMSVAAIRDDELKEFRPLARIAAPLTFVQSCFLAALFFFLNTTVNLAASFSGLAALLLVMLFPARWLARDKK